LPRPVSNSMRRRTGASASPMAVSKALPDIGRRLSFGRCGVAGPDGRIIEAYGFDLSPRALRYSTLSPPGRPATCPTTRRAGATSRCHRRRAATGARVSSWLWGEACRVDGPRGCGSRPRARLDQGPRPFPTTVGGYFAGTPACAESRRTLAVSRPHAGANSWCTGANSWCTGAGCGCS
jgi:hypothetical protein